MKLRSLSFLALVAAAGALTILGGCTTETTTRPVAGGHGPYNPVAYKPHNPNAVRVKVSLSNQVVYVMEGSKPLLVAATTVGVPGHETPTGHFTITRKERDKRSGTYGFFKTGDVVVPGERSDHKPGTYIGYPMAFWCEFEPAFGFHQGYVWPVPRSHGCLRLHPKVASKFFALVHPGTPVDIEHTQSEDATIGKDVQRPTDYKDPDPPAAYSASPAVFQAPPGSDLVPY